MNITLDEIRQFSDVNNDYTDNVCLDDKTKANNTIIPVRDTILNNDLEILIAKGLKADQLRYFSLSHDNPDDINEILTKIDSSNKHINKTSTNSFPVNDIFKLNL